MCEEGEEIRILKRTPRIFLVGDPEKLGYDKDSAEWLNVKSTVYLAICESEDVPTGLIEQTIEDWENIYYIELPENRQIKIEAMFDKQCYDKFGKLLGEATDDIKNMPALFDHSPLCLDYAIPKQNTAERVWFDRMVKMWKQNFDAWNRLCKRSVEAWRKFQKGIEKVEK